MSCLAAGPCQRSVFGLTATAHFVKAHSLLTTANTRSTRRARCTCCDSWSAAPVQLQRHCAHVSRGSRLAVEVALDGNLVEVPTAYLVSETDIGMSMRSMAKIIAAMPELVPNLKSSQGFQNQDTGCSKQQMTKSTRSSSASCAACAVTGPGPAGGPVQPVVGGNRQGLRAAHAGGSQPAGGPPLSAPAVAWHERPPGRRPSQLLLPVLGSLAEIGGGRR